MDSVFELVKKNTIAGPILSELRNVNVQNDRERFRYNLKRIGSLIAYELSHHLEYDTTKIQTPLAESSALALKRQPILLTLLRAGLPFLDGFGFYFDHADRGFIGSFRKEEGESISIEMGYMAIPNLEGRTLIVADPMLATGSSLLLALEGLKSYGTPSSLHIACVIAAQAGVDNIKNSFPEAHLWCGAIDPILNEKSYIVPGLGDAGDLSFGAKT